MLIALLLLLQVASPPVGVEVYRAEKGLNANALYGVLVDPNGFVWVHTDNGLYRYDGNSFKVVPATLGREVILANFVDSTTIAALSFDNSIELIDIRRLSSSETLVIPDSLKLNSFASTVRRFGDTLYVGTSERRVLRRVGVRWENFLIPLNPPHFYHAARVAMFEPVKDGILVASSGGSWVLKDTSMVVDLDKLQVSGKPSFNVDRWWLPGKTELFSLGDEGVDREWTYTSLGVKSFVHQVLWRRESELWLATKEEGLLVFNFEQSRFIKKTLLDFNEISGLAMDSDGTVWVSTQRNGLYKYHSWFDRFEAIRYVNDVFLERTIFTSENLIVAEFEGAFIQSSNSSYTKLLDGPIHFVGNGFGDDLILGQIDDSYLVKKDGAMARLDQVIERSGAKLQHPIKFLHVAGDHLALSAPSGVFVLDMEESKLLNIYPGRSTAVLLLDQDRIVIGRPNSLEFRNRESGLRLWDSPYRVTFFNLYDSTSILIGTNGDGLIRFDTRTYSGEQILPGSWNSIHRLDKDTYAIVGAPGLFVVKLDDQMSFVRLSEIPLTPDGFAQQIRHVRLSADGDLWLSTEQGVLKVAYAQVYNLASPPRLRISDVFGDGKYHNPMSTIVASKDVGGFSISLSVQGDFNPNTHNLEYMSGDADSIWTPLSQPSIEIESIRKGLTTFRFRLRNVLTDHVVSEVSLSIDKEPYWWETTWAITFGLISTLLVTVGATTMVQRRFHRRKMEDLALQDRMRELERVAVTRLLSSHYLFNALATIRSVARRSTDEVNWYIGRLSKVIRALIDRTSQNEVDLQSELDWIRDYVALESVGRQLAIEFSVTMDDDLDADEIFLPAFILQPVVENAMFHGALKHDPVIRCDVRRVDDRLHIFIRNRIDPASKHDPNDGSSSRGLLFLTERLKGWGRYHGFQLESDDVLAVRHSDTEWSTELKLPFMNHELPLVNRA